MKHEINAEIMLEFFGLRSVMYDIILMNDEIIKMVQGVNDASLKTITFDNLLL